MPDACRSCGAPIVWGITAKGHRMPIDPDPHPDGNVRYQRGRGDRGEDLADVLSGVRLSEARTIGYALHRSHFASCPNAGQHRRRDHPQ